MILLSVASNSSIVCILAHFSSEIVPVYCIIGCLTVASIFVSFAINDAKVQLFFDVCKELSIFLQKIFLFAVNPLCQRPRTLQTYTAKDNTNFRKSSYYCYGIIDAVWTGKIKRCECFGSPKLPYTKGHNTPKVFKYAAKLHKKIDICKSYADFFSIFLLFYTILRIFCSFCASKSAKRGFSISTKPLILSSTHPLSSERLRRK